jgi:hypothetical protein
MITPSAQRDSRVLDIHPYVMVFSFSVARYFDLVLRLAHHVASSCGPISGP